MGRQVAIVIGIERSGQLPRLPGARRGAEDFARWACEAGFEVRELHDWSDHPVTASTLFTAVNDVTRAGDVERLIIFFAGHGVAKGTYVGYWLLSLAPDNPNEAVNVANSVRLARRCGIPHVVVIGDACRTMAGKDHGGLAGQVIFPSADISDTELDQFYASVSGDPAYEVVPDNDVLAAYGIFTECLMQALEGKAPEATERVLGGTQPLAVTAKALRDYLRRSVPLEAGKKGLKQYPDCIPGSYWPPNVIAWIEEGEPTLAPPPPPPAPAPQPDVAAIFPLGQEEIDAAAREFASHPGRGHFETASGLTVIGAVPRDAAVEGGHGGLFEEDGAWHVRGTGKPGAAVVDLGDGRFAATALLPGFVSTVHVGRGGVDLVSYQGVPTWRYGETPETSDALATLGAAARAGFYDVAVDEATRIADHFRNYKHQNPTFGVFAAYAYDRAGLKNRIRSMIEYFADAEQVVPYDLALLAGVEPGELRVPVAPRFPLLTQGWAYLDPARLHPAVTRARDSLAPSVWATPTGDGGRALFDAVMSGESL